ncbi:hypothetical protein CCACVL1_05146 [Corchorus capsularis]|uniref:Uncharacterized protein n=1 Tax=Corchorus capsularis TaxID=210143 RepID=A0A1R3JMF3_COCAP|nr:hypothetical protein CCACVL1_05146 [Corchorus capsularis]
MPSYEPLLQFDKSSINADQAVPQHFDFAKDPNKGSLPKLLFAEWLSLDQEGGNFANSGKAVASSDGFNQDHQKKKRILERKVIKADGHFGRRRSDSGEPIKASF